MPIKSLSNNQPCPICLDGVVNWLGNSPNREDNKNWACSSCGSAWTAPELIQCLNYIENTEEED
jgi:hypothetical protein